jgi:hypothetical protein
MRQPRINENRTATCKPLTWYQIYFAAMVEGDGDKALLQFVRAQRAIEDRLVELRTLPPSNPREPQDLNNALTYLGILLENLDAKSESLFWN